jgi:hypothetical protein
VDPPRDPGSRGEKPACGVDRFGSRETEQVERGTRRGHRRS